MTTKHKKKTKNKVLIILTAILLVVAGIYVFFAMNYQSKFLPGTKVYGVEVSQLTTAQAQNKLKKDLKNTTFVLKDKKNIVGEISGKKLGIQNDFTPLLKNKLSEQNPWLFKKCAETQSSSQIVHAAFDNNAVNGFVESLFPAINENRVVTQNAKIVNIGGRFKVQPEIVGNNFDANELKVLVSKAIQSGKKNIQLEKHYVKPILTKDSKKINQLKDQMQKLSEVNVTYNLANHTIEIPNEELASWLETNGDKVSFSDAKILAYFNQINGQYATLGKSRTFNSTKRGAVNVSGGTYGWKINTDSEIPKLKELIFKGNDFSREPIIQGNGYHKDGTDIGNTYVEVDKVNQHMYIYTDGKQVISTDIVTGKPGQDTPSGVFNVWSKTRNTTLRGFNDDGSRYASPVSYWMPIDNTGVGLHDSPWQPKYGGDWWRTHGSHGCVNTPPATMTKVYDAVAVGTPVIVF